MQKEFLPSAICRVDWSGRSGAAEQWRCIAAGELKFGIALSTSRKPGLSSSTRRSSFQPFKSKDLPRERSPFAWTELTGRPSESLRTEVVTLTDPESFSMYGCRASGGMNLKRQLKSSSTSGFCWELTASQVWEVNVPLAEDKGGAWPRPRSCCAREDW